MAELTHFYVEQNTEFTTSDNGVVFTGVQIDGSALSANTKYLAVGRLTFGTASATETVQIRLDSDDDSDLGFKTLMEVEFQQTGSGAHISYFAVHSFTTDASPADVTIRLSSGSTDEIRVDQQSIFLLDLDAIGTEGVDYYEDIQADSGDEYAVSPATTVLASLAGSDLGTDEHLILGCSKTLIGSTGRYFHTQLDAAYDTATSTARTNHRAEGEDTAEQRIVGFAIRHKASSGTPDVTLRGDEEAANGNMLDGGAYLIALPTALFADFVDDHTVAGIGVDGTETTIATSGSYTPTTTGNHLIIGTAFGDNTPTALGGMWVESTTTEIRTGDSTPTHNQIWDDTKDGEVMNTFQRYSMTIAETFNLRAQGGNFFDVQHRWLIVVNLNEPAAGGPALFPPFLRRPPRHVRM